MTKRIRVLPGAGCRFYEPTHMKEQIQKEIQQLEALLDIKILYAVESGSRAWGFASANSDWDVRFIYIHRKEWYLRIDDGPDNYEKILPNDIDLGGWEIRKALKLFRKSNPPLLEWLQSPLVYCEDNPFAERLREQMKIYFNPKSCLHHYLHMADGNYKTYLQKEMVRVKKYFYVLRPILACDWIMNTNSMAPMEFSTLLDTQVTDAAIAAEIRQLLTRKASGEELAEEPKITMLNTYLESKLAFFRDYVRAIDAPVAPSSEDLHQLFRQTLEETWT